MATETEGGVGRADLQQSETECPARKHPAAPRTDALPKPVGRAVRDRKEALCTIDVKLKVVTPILGGAAVKRAIDEIDVIRAATVRGHLRFWWRALYGHEYASAAKLFESESRLWGHAAGDEGGRSAVDVTIEHDRNTVGTVVGPNSIPQQQFYALWPARNPPADRRLPGTVFVLGLKAPKGCEPILRNVVRAWILFGGYGSRTRRGLGSLTLEGDSSGWLPPTATPEAFTELFGRDVFDPRGNPAKQMPLLAGAALYVGTPGREPEKCWTDALGWLKEFRQGPRGGAKGSAREPDGGGDIDRPSVSNWPEADKVRHLSVPDRGLPWAHDPAGRHNSVAAWPRGGFGLPIVGQFQMQSRKRGMRYNTDRQREEEYLIWWDQLPNPRTEPRDACQLPTERRKKYGFELRWRSDKRPNIDEPYWEHDRLASPLIVKALPLANGQYASCALWLARSMPSGAEVGISELVPGHAKKKRVNETSVAPFDRIEDAPGSALFIALRNCTTLRDAFLGWLGGTIPGSVKKATRVAP